MAIYRSGQASMDAQGYITGYETKWREQLTLIRPGATIFFIDAPFQAAVISEVISDTQIRAITTGGAEIGRSNYIILLHDSITVDGLAQDVAETLRYYQSKETQIEEAIEFFKNFDLKQLQDLANQVKGDAEKTAADRSATEQLKNDTQQIKDSAVAETNQIKADTDAIKAQTQQIKNSAITETEDIKQEALGARDQAELARDAAGNHAVDANNAKAGAETARDEARQWAQQIHPENLLRKDQNLNDLENKDLAREVLKVDRFNQGDGETFIQSPDKSKYLTLGNDGWGYWNVQSQQFIPLGVQRGGTGAGNVTQARINLELDRVEQKLNETKILSPNKKTYVFINDGDWGCYNIDYGTIPLSVARGGTGGTTDEEARNNLKIDKFVQTESDTRILNQSKNHTFFITDADWGYLNNSNSERVPLPIISGGTGGTTTFSACRSLRAMNYDHTGNTYYASPELDTGIGFYSADVTPWPGGNGGPYTYAEIMTIAEGGGGPGSAGNWSQIGFSTITNQAPRYRQRTSNPALITNWRDFLIRDLNTTVDSNGFIKIASPIVKIKGDGSAEFNMESEGCVVTRDDIGVYTIKGCLGLNSDAAWGGSDGGFEIPTDINKQPRIWLDYSVKPDGSVTIRTYHRTHPNSPEFARNEIEGFLDGDPIDIPDGCFISVRVQMPNMN